MDPFAKMLSTIIFIVTLLITNNFTVMFILTIVTAIMLLRSNVPFGLYSKSVSSLQQKAREQKYAARLHKMESMTILMLVCTGGGGMLLLLVSMLMMLANSM